MLIDPIGGGRFILADDRMTKWVASRLPHLGPHYDWPSAVGLGVVSDGKIIAGMVVHDYTKYARNCQISFAADTPRWATRNTIAALLRYPFGQLGVSRLTTIIARDNERSIRFNLGIGFEQEGCCIRGMGDQDALIFGLLKERAPAWMKLAQFPEIE